MNLEHLIQDKGEQLLMDDPKTYFRQGEPDYLLLANKLTEDEYVYRHFPTRVTISEMKALIIRALKKRHWKHMLIRDSHLHYSYEERMRAREEQQRIDDYRRKYEF